MPREVFTALRRGMLVDIMRARAEVQGQHPAPTFHGGTGAETRTDVVPTDPWVALLVQEGRVVRKQGLPRHSLLRVDMLMNGACHQVTKIRRLEEPLKPDMRLTEYRGPAQAF